MTTSLPHAPLRATLCCAALLIAAAAGCASTTPAAPPPTATLYDRIGGLAAIDAVVDDAIVYLSDDTRINGRFATTSVPHLKRQLVDLVCLRTGGPCAYTGANMAAAHEGLFIRSDEFDALVEDVTRALDKHRVPPRERAELLAILGQMRGSVIEH